jgi:hypothetical protein
LIATLSRAISMGCLANTRVVFSAGMRCEYAIGTPFHLGALSIF